MRRLLMVGGFGLVLVLTACGGTAQVAAAPLTAEAETYLAVVSEIQGDLDGTFDSVGETLSRVYNTREALFTAFRNAGLPGATGNALTRATALTPPPEFETDHQLWLDGRHGLVDLVDDLEAALEHQDVYELLSVLNTAQQGGAEMMLGTSREFCMALAGPGEEAACPPPDDLPGGEYGKTVYEILRRQNLLSSFFFDFHPDMSPEERALRLDVVQPNIENALKSTAEALAELDPPSEYSADHAVLIRFYEEQHSTATAITTANAARDDARVLELFDESGVVWDRMVDSLSDKSNPILAPIFLADG